MTTINKPQLKALSEIAHNVLKGIVTLSPSEKVKLKRYKKILTLLGRKRLTRREKLAAIHRGATAVVRLINIVGRTLWTR